MTAKKTSNRDILRQLLPTLTADDQTWLRQQLLGWKTQPKLHNSTHLDSRELLALESWLWERYGEASTMRERLPRLRNWFIFMLLRYGGMLPKEIFALTMSDLDWENSQIVVREGESMRLVPLAPPIIRRMQNACEHFIFPEDGSFLHCDDGFMRRSLNQCATACGLPAGLVNARSLRRYRAQELLQQGIPLPVVDIFLGRTSNASNTIMRYNPEAAMELLHTHLQSDRPMKSSARNIFQGRIVELESSGILVRVVLATPGGLRVTAFITDVSRKRLELDMDKLVNASVKAPWVMVSPHGGDSQDMTSALPENIFVAEVENVRQKGLFAEILAKLEDGSQICALHNVSAGSTVPLKTGDKARIAFNAFAVILTI